MQCLRMTHCGQISHSRRKSTSSTRLTICFFSQHTSHSNGRTELSTRSGRTGVRSRSSDEPQQPHVGNYRLLKTIGKGNFAKVKLARHILTGREVSSKKGQGKKRNHERCSVQLFSSVQLTSLIPVGRFVLQ